MKHLPYKVVNDNNKPKIQFEIRGEMKTLAPEEITAMMLSKMKETAEAYVDMEVEAVITVPVSYNRCQRQAIRDAASIAGLGILTIVPAPAAASLAFEYWRDTRNEWKAIVIDLGGGTLDIAVICLEDGIIEVISYAGDMHLGGEDFDNRLVTHCVQAFKMKHKKDISQNAHAMCKLRIACEKAKCELSTNFTASIQLASLFDGIDFHTSITQSQFEEMCADLFSSIVNPIDRALRDTKRGRDEIQDVVLMGGSTRIPKVQEILKEFFNGKELNIFIDLGEGLSCGAAMQAAIRMGDKNDAIYHMLLLDATTKTLSFGIEMPGGVMNPIYMFKRSTTYPTKQTHKFATEEDNQENATVNVYEGDSTISTNNHLCGTFKVSGLLRSVTFEMDGNGNLDYEVESSHSGKFEKVVIKNSGDYLSREELDQMISKAARLKEGWDRQKTNAKKQQIKSAVFEYKQAAETVRQKCDEVLDWFDKNPEAQVDEFNQKLQKVQELWQRRS